MPSKNCKWCLCELEDYARPGGECSNCWEIRKRCQGNPRVGLLIAMSIGQEFLLEMVKKCKGAVFPKEKPQ